MNRKLDEKLALQRAQEEKAEAKLAARKAQAGGMGPRIPSRDNSGLEPPGADQGRPSGPPRLNLAPRTVPTGGGSSWREKQAAAAAGGATSETSPSEEATKAPAGFMPPALREAAATTDGWRGRETSGRSGSGRDESPATTGPGKYAPPAARGDSRFTRDMGERGSNGRGRLDVRDRGESPATGGTGGRYVPRHLRDQGRDASPASSTDGSRPPPSGAASDGKYRPGAFSSRKT
jgi:translation initiation factor 3 subunit A